MLDFLNDPFLQRPLIAGALIGAVAGYYGVFIIQRRLSFLASGIGHAAFGGVALGILLGTEPLYIALPFSIVVAALIKWVQERTPLSADTSIGILFSVAMALGIIFLALTPHYSVDAFTYLFGSIAYVTWMDVGAAGLLALFVAATLPMWGRWAYATLDEDLARADGLRTRRDDYLLFLCLAVTIVVAMKIVGIVLVTAFVIIPAAAARLVAGRLKTMTLLAVGLGIATSVAGLLLSSELDLPSGPVMILIQTLVFAVLAGIGRLR